MDDRRNSGIKGANRNCRHEEGGGEEEEEDREAEGEEEERGEEGEEEEEEDIGVFSSCFRSNPPSSLSLRSPKPSSCRTIDKSEEEEAEADAEAESEEEGRGREGKGGADKAEAGTGFAGSHFRLRHSLSAQATQRLMSSSSLTVSMSSDSSWYKI